MLTSLAQISSIIKVKFSANIDNVVAKLHYRLTTLILFTCVVLISTMDLIGDRIHCNVGQHLSDDHLHFVNTFCFIYGTFTVNKHFNNSENAIYPGVGPYVHGKDATRYHTFYQWVPFVLFLQALLFYAPHYLWKNFEDGKLKQFSGCFEFLVLATQSDEQSVHRIHDDADIVIPSRTGKHEKFVEVSKCFVERLSTFNLWAFGLVTSEVLNFINVIGNIYFINSFLGGTFLRYGSEVVSFLSMDPENRVDPMHFVFPKMTKCLFNPFGHSGSVNQMDLLCLLPQNIVNEKVYVVLWFWFVILSALSAAALAWRLVTISLHSRSEILNRYIFYSAHPVNINPSVLNVIMKKLSYSEWLFLYHIGKSIDGFVFQDFMKYVAQELDPHGKYVALE